MAFIVHDTATNKFWTVPTDSFMVIKALVHKQQDALTELVTYINAKAFPELKLNERWLIRGEGLYQIDSSKIFAPSPTVGEGQEIDPMLLPNQRR